VKQYIIHFGSSLSFFFKPDKGENRKCNQVPNFSVGVKCAPMAENLNLFSETFLGTDDSVLQMKTLAIELLDEQF